jgi:Icc-related predicted phosphoesterase
MRILFLTDLHAATDYAEPLAGELERADLLLLGGDITNFGGRREVAAMLAPLRAKVPRTLAVPGNVDGAGVLDWLEDEGISLHGRAERLGGDSVGEVGLFGCGGSNHTPLKAPTEFDEETLADLLEQARQQVADVPRTILLTHVPPYGTALDRIFTGRHVGSTALRNFIERHQPSLCLCGHVHEAAGLAMLGQTQLCNAGAPRNSRSSKSRLATSNVSCAASVPRRPSSSGSRPVTMPPRSKDFYPVLWQNPSVVCEPRV